MAPPHSPRKQAAAPARQQRESDSAGPSCAVTADAAPALSEVWPEVAERLRTYLIRSGAPSALIPDLVQDVAEAAIRQKVKFTSADDLMRWGRVVAQRKLWRELKRTSRADVAEPSIALEGDERVEDAAIARRQLEVTLAATDLLPRQHLEALTTPPPRGGKRERDRHSLRLLRARRKLEELAKRFGFGLVARRMSSLGQVDVCCRWPSCRRTWR